MKKNIQKGFSALAVILIVAVIGIIGFAGYRIYQMQGDGDNNSQVPAASEQKIENAEDLKAAEDMLNEADIDALDTKELDEIEKELL